MWMSGIQPHVHRYIRRFRFFFLPFPFGPWTDLYLSILRLRPFMTLHDFLELNVFDFVIIYLMSEIVHVLKSCPKSTIYIC
jgi:hypothetical protein